MMENFMISLGIMGKGMAGIFVVIGILTVLVTVFGKISNKGKEETK